MRTRSVTLPRWTIAAAISIFLLLGAVTAAYAARLHALREAVLARESAVPGLLERHSAFAERCEDRWSNRLKSWLLRTDVCDPWL